jgi:type I restriction enzyme R subunit
LLKQAQTLCQSLLDKNQRYESAYFEAIRVATGCITEHGKLSFTEINNQINELLRQSIKSEGVISLFGDKHQDFSLFDPKFLEEISRMKEKNLAAELLRKLIVCEGYIPRPLAAVLRVCTLSQIPYQINQLRPLCGGVG